MTPRPAARRLPRACAALLAAGVALLVALSCAPAGPARAAGAAAGSGAQPGDASPSGTDQGSLVDTFMAGQEQGQGLALALSVAGGTPVERYYGSADAAGQTAVDASTAFEWGRCADAVVWACVMQLAEAGDLSLEAPVAGNLPEGVALPDGYAGLTMLDLMNHTSGLDVAMNGARSSLPDGTASVVPAFALFSVEARYDPGDVVAYTPYDALLAAAVVEQVSGSDFVEYVRANVLDRLGMDDTYLMVGGSPARLARQDGVPVQAVSLAEGSDGPASVSSPRSATSSVLSCFGTVGDLLKLANGLMGAEGWPSAFDDPATSDELFAVTRTYPSLGVARVAHGLFAFPFTAGVYGISATTSSGFSASLYMDLNAGLAVAIMVNQSGRADLTQGIPRVLVGRSDATVADASSPANATWVGTYQDSSSPDHGPSKLLTALQRVTVGVNAQGVITFDGLTATSLGAGVYSVDSAIDQDAYRFHVSLERGAEFSRIASDYCSVPWSTLAVEGGLLALFAAAWVLSGAYAAVGGVAWARGLLAPRRRARVQPSVLLLALATFAAGTAAAVAELQLAEGLAPAALGALLAGEGVYVACAALLGAWLAATRLRNPRTWPPRQRAACIAVAFAALMTVLNLAYWEMLP